jgi:hypothetical protein
MDNFNEIKNLHNKINSLLLDIKEIKSDLYEEYSNILNDSTMEFVNLGAKYINDNPQEFQIFLNKLRDIIKILNFIKTKENIREIIQEQKRDRCLRIADRKFDKPSAYKSGAVVRCRKGDIWKGLKENHKAYAKERYEADLIEGKVGNLYHTTNATAATNILKEGYINPANINLKQYIGTSNPPWWYSDEFGEPQPLYGDFIYAASNYKEGFFGVSNPEVTFIIDGDKVKNSGIDIYKAPESMEKGVCLIQGSVSLKFINKIIINGDLIDKEDKINLILIIKNKKIKYIVYDTLLKGEQLTEKQKETLRTWFKRKGAPGKTGGWVDCNSPIRKNGKITGYKPCGRQKGEERAKYPSCRPTAARCKDKGKGIKWGKTK